MFSCEDSLALFSFAFLLFTFLYFFSSVRRRAIKLNNRSTLILHTNLLNLRSPQTTIYISSLAHNKINTIGKTPMEALSLNIPPTVGLTDEQFYQLCIANEEWRHIQSVKLPRIIRNKRSLLYFFQQHKCSKLANKLYLKTL